MQEARLSKGWTPEAAAKITKIKVDRLHEIERDDYSKLPGVAYTRGLVRVYARELGLDERRILERLDQMVSMDLGEGYIVAPPVEYLPQEVHYSQQVSTRRMGSYVIYGVLVVFVIATISWMVKLGNGWVEKSKKNPVVTTQVISDRTIAKAAPATAGVPVKAAKPVTPVAPVAKAVKESEIPETKEEKPAEVKKEVKLQKLALHAREECWVSLRVTREGETKVVFKDIIPAGETREFEGERFGIRLSVPAGMDIIYNDKNEGPYSDSRIPSDEFYIPAQ